MKTDSIFFRIFQTDPGILFELLGESSDLGKDYEFRSVEVKQTAFRIDGVFVPKSDALDQTVVFVEVQFQLDEYLYDRMFAEIGMYLTQNRSTVDWRAVAIFPRRSIEPKEQYRHRSLLQGEQFISIYLEDLLDVRSELIGIQLMQMVVSKPNESVNYAREILDKLQEKSDFQSQAIIELVSTIMVYKFPGLSREAIERMFSVSELKQTRVYQEALDEGRAEGELSIILRLLACQVGEIALSAESQIRALSLTQLEDLGEALLDFNAISDLEDWLEKNQCDRLSP